MRVTRFEPLVCAVLLPPAQCPSSLPRDKPSHLPTKPTARAHASHVILPKELSKQIPRDRLLGEQEWRQMGVQQSRGWVHYAIHRCVCRPLLLRLLWSGRTIGM